MGKQILSDCKTFIHRFDSDRRLQQDQFAVFKLTHVAHLWVCSWADVDRNQQSFRALLLILPEQ